MNVKYFMGGLSSYHISSVVVLSGIAIIAARFREPTIPAIALAPRSSCTGISDPGNMSGAYIRARREGVSINPVEHYAIPFHYGESAEVNTCVVHRLAHTR